MERIMAREYPLVIAHDALELRDLTDAIVIHHTGNAIDDDLSAEDINAIHRSLGWLAIGYHYVIRKDGSIELGRPRWTTGAHAEGENHHTVGIMLCGNFDVAEPMPCQIESCAMLIANLADGYSLDLDADTIIGHRDLCATSCPGDNLYDKIPIIIGKAIWYACH